MRGMLGVRLIEIPAWGTVTVIEAIWLALGLVTLGFTVPHLRPLVRELRAIERGRPVLYRIQAGYVRREIGRMIQGLAITTLGVYFVVQKNPLGANVVTVGGLVITLVLFVIASAAAVMSAWDWRDREIVQRDLESGLNGHAKPVPSDRPATIPTDG